MIEIVNVKVKRFDPESKLSYWQSFNVDYRKNMNVISLLMEIRKNPVTSDGIKVPPVAWDCNCLEKVCGACAMIINGAPTTACSTLLHNIFKEKGSGSQIILEPLSKFPVVKDLIVDRTFMFDSLKKANAWIDTSKCEDIEKNLVIDEKTHKWTYSISKCMTCGCCIEACPNINNKTSFIGPQTVSQVLMLGAHPNGKHSNHLRLDGITDVDGIHQCGNAQNCKRACPKSIDLTLNMALTNREITKHAFKKIFKRLR